MSGHGNNGDDGFEGAVHGRVIGTYLHGPLLPKNPRLADLLIRLAPLDPNDLEEELIGEVERFAAGKLGDDLTMLVLRRI